MSDDTFNILVLSDFHYKHDDKGKFEAVFNPFLKCLENLVKERNEWAPQCVMLAGDIVHCTRKESSRDYNYMIERMDAIRTALGGNIPIVSVPGNHDKNTSSVLGRKKKGNFGKVFFEKYCAKEQPRRKNLNSVVEALECCFGQYASFVSKYHVASNWNPMPELGLSGDEAKWEKISGYYILEAPRICIIALNTEWEYGASKQMTIGRGIVQKMFPIAEDYRSKGYFVITLMHRDPGSLRWEDRYSENLDKPSPMERMIRVSDLVICAHEHVVREVPPDILMDSTILYRNGCMFTNNKESVGRYPYSASLLKIDQKNRLLQVLKLNRELAGDGCGWTLSPIKTYCWQHRETPVITPAKRINRIYKEIWMQYPLDTQILEEKILSLYFPDGRAPDFMHVVCCLFEVEDKAKETAWQEMMRVKDKTLTLLFYAKLNSWGKDDLEALIDNYKGFQKELQDHANETGLEAVFNLVLCKILG